MILAIDPGPTVSAWVLWDKKLYGMGIEPTPDVLSRIEMHRLGSPTAFDHDPCPDFMVVEKVESFGMAVGSSVFETVYWTGRMAQAWHDDASQARMGRKDVKMYLCKSMRAKDANIRQAVMDRFGSTRGAAIGVKASPGPLYGVKSHIWAAIALAITYEETR